MGESPGLTLAHVMSGLLHRLWCDMAWPGLELPCSPKTAAGQMDRQQCVCVHSGASVGGIVVLMSGSAPILCLQVGVKLKPENCDIAYPPIIQSGGKYDLKVRLALGWGREVGLICCACTAEAAGGIISQGK